MTCANCEALRDKVRRLERELSFRYRVGEIGAVAEHLGITGQQAKIMLRLFHAGVRWTSTEALVAEEFAPTASTIRAHIHFIRRYVGTDSIVGDLRGRGCLGYKLGAPGAAMIEAALRPLELQDARGCALTTS